MSRNAHFYFFTLFAAKCCRMASYDMKDVLQDAFDDKRDNISSNLEEIASLMAAANALTASSTVTINDTLNELLRFYSIDPISTGIKKTTGYASGAKRANKDETAWVNEYGTELMVSPTDNAILAGIKKDTGIISARLTDNLFDWGEIDLAHFISSMTRKLNDCSSTGQIGTSINQHYDSLLNVEGNVDSTVISDMKKFTQNFYKGAYEYTVKEIVRDAVCIGFICNEALSIIENAGFMGMPLPEILRRNQRRPKKREKRIEKIHL